MHTRHLAAATSALLVLGAGLYAQTPAKSSYLTPPQAIVDILDADDDVQNVFTNTDL